MHEIKEKAKKLGEMKEKLVEWSKTELDRGREQVDTKEMGEVIDMIKDLAEAEKDCYKAVYYCEVVQAMKEGGDDEGRMGYDNWRRSSGRFAPKGQGSYRPGESGRRGYPMPAEGYWPQPEYGPWGDRDGNLMGYDGDGRSRSSQSGSNNSGGSDGSSSGRMGYRDPDWDRIMTDERYGRPFKEWRLSKRHYTETKADGDKHEMSEHAKEHMADTVMTIKEIWTGADPELKTKMKQDLTKLMEEMK